MYLAGRGNIFPSQERCQKPKILVFDDSFSIDLEQLNSEECLQSMKEATKIIVAR